MNIRVCFFASLREVVGTGELQVEADSFKQIALALEQKLAPEALGALSADNVRIALDQSLLGETWAQLMRSDAPLTDASELAFLPPVTGG